MVCMCERGLSDSAVAIETVVDKLGSLALEFPGSNVLDLGSVSLLLDIEASLVTCSCENSELVLGSR